MTITHFWVVHLGSLWIFYDVKTHKACNRARRVKVRIKTLEKGGLLAGVPQEKGVLGHYMPFFCQFYTCK